MKRNKTPESVSSPTPGAQRTESRRKRDIDAKRREEKTPSMMAYDPRNKPIGSREDLLGAMGVTPMDVLGRVAGHTKSYGLAAFAGALKAAETFRAAKNTNFVKAPVRTAVRRSVELLSKRRKPIAQPVARVIPGKNTTPLTVVHSLSPESMAEAAANGLLVNPSANIQAVGGRGWLQHAGGYVNSGNRTSSADSVFLVDLAKPSSQGFARAADMYSSTVTRYLEANGKLMPAEKRAKLYAHEKLMKQAGSALDYSMLKQRLQSPGLKYPVRPYEPGSVGWDLTSPQPNFFNPKVMAMRATQTSQDLVNTIEALKVKPGVANLLIEQSMQPQSFGARLSAYSDILRTSRLHLHPKDTRTLFSALENTRLESLSRIGPGLTETRYHAAPTIEYKPAKDISLDGRTVIFTGQDARDMVPTLQKRFPNTRFVEGGNLYSETGNSIDREFNTFMDVKGGDTRQDSKGGDAGQGSDAPAPEPSPAVPASGPRIVINPSTFRNKKDALCVAWNERLRIWMEDHDFQPRAEPTQEQREFFSDTPYAEDELQMRRTILARIATLDTSIRNPTDMQLGETVEMLQGFAQTETPSNEYEAKSLSRLIELVDHVHRTSGANDEDLNELIGEPDDPEETGSYVDDGDLEEFVREDLPDDLDAELTDEESDDLNQLTAEEP